MIQVIKLENSKEFLINSRNIDCIRKYSPKAVLIKMLGGSTHIVIGTIDEIKSKVIDFEKEILKGRND